MYGKHVGILNVFMVVRGTRAPHPTWRKTREAGQLWKLEEVRLPANSTIKVRTIFNLCSWVFITCMINVDIIRIGVAVPQQCKSNLMKIHCCMV